MAHKVFLSRYPWHTKFFCHGTRGTQNFPVTLLVARTFFSVTVLVAFKFLHGTRGTHNFSVMVPVTQIFFCYGTRGTQFFPVIVPVTHAIFLSRYPWHTIFFCHSPLTHSFLSRNPWHTHFFCHCTLATHDFSQFCV